MKDHEMIHLLCEKKNYSNYTLLMSTNLLFKHS